MFLSQFARRAGVAALFFLSASAAVHAQSEPAAADSPLPTIGTIVTGDRYAEPLAHSSRTTFVIDRAHIDAIGARTVADALRDVPGVQLYRYGAFGAQVNYGIRATASAQTLVLLDGAPIAAGSNGTIDLGTVSTAGVTRIEVVEGAASALYGTSAVGGVINIITGAPRAALLDVAAGSLGDRTVRAEGRAGNFGAAFERHTADNVYDYPALDGFGAGKRANADAQFSAGKLFYDADLSKLWHLKAAAGADVATIGVPGGLSFLTPNARQRTSRNNALVEISRVGATSTLAFTVSGSRQNLAYADPDNGGESDTYDGRINASLRYVAGNAHNTLVTGIDFSRESAKIDLGTSGPPPNFSAVTAQSAAYAQYSHAFAGGSRLYAGLRAEHDAPQGSVLAPSAGGILALGSVRLAANASESYRVPTIVDLYYPGFSNPALQPEKSRYLDALLQAPIRRGDVSLGWFGRNAANLIQLDSNFVPQNTQLATIRGLMLNARTTTPHGLIVTLGLTNLYRATDDSPGAGAARLNFQPAFEAALGLEQPLTPAHAGFGVHAHVASPHIESKLLRNGATVLDAFLRIHLAPAAVLALRARNFGGERYAPIAGYPAAGRTFEAELSTR